MTRVALGVLVSIALCLCGGAAAMAAGSSPGFARRWAPEIPLAQGGSANWSGYVLSSGFPGFDLISATWRVPAVSATPGTFTDSATWTGIDGTPGNDSLIQAGTEQGYSGESAFYDAWWEIYPGTAQVMFPVKPGDNIVVSIHRTTGTQYAIYLADTNSGQSFSELETYSGSDTSAEFVQEAPTVNNSVVPLAHFAPVTFRNVRVGGGTPPLGSAESVMMTQNGRQVATPSQPAFAANAFTVAYGASTPSPPATPAFETHASGSVWVSTGAACHGSGCPGWQEIDNNPEQDQISAGDGSVYELHVNGSVWEWTGGVCTTSSCPGWVELGDDPSTVKILAGSGELFAVHSDGSIWLANGVPCVNGTCPGWTEIDDNPAATNIVAGADTIFETHTDGSIWEWTKAPCVDGSCQGWEEIDDNPATVQLRGDFDTVYQLHSDGSIWVFDGTPCGAGGCTGWAELGDNPATTEISAGDGKIYQLRTDGSIWRSTGERCSRTCGVWTELDDNPEATGIAASETSVYELHDNGGSIWRWMGALCSGGSCPGWVELDDNPSTTAISVENAQ